MSAATATDAFPTFPQGYGNGSVAERTNHPLRYNVFQNMLQAHPEIQALFACSDLMALGAVEAIAAAGKTGKIVVVGFDAFSEARAAVNKGTMDATIAQSSYDMGKTAVENALKVIKGEKIQEDVSLKVELVTKTGSGTAAGH